MNDDRINELYDGAIGTASHQKRARRRIHWLCAQVAGDRVLDAGCSQGIAALLLGREGRTVVGVDREHHAIEFALARLEQEEAEVRERVTFVVGELAGLTFEADSFDGVLLGEVLEHQIDPRPALMEIARVLRPGGVLALTTPYGHFPYHDHKEPIYLSALLATLTESFAIDQLSVIDAYLAIAAHPRTDADRGLGRIDWRSALDVAEQRLRAQEEAFETQKAAAEKAKGDAAAGRDQLAKLRTELRQAAAAAEALKPATAELEGARAYVSELEVAVQGAREETETARRDAETAHRDGEAARRGAEATRRETEGARRDAEVARRETEVARRETEAAHRDAEAATSRLAARDQRVEELSEQSVRLEQKLEYEGETLREALREVVAARAAVDELRRERQALRNSLSAEREAAAAARAERDDARRRGDEPVASRAAPGAKPDRIESDGQAVLARNGDGAVKVTPVEPEPVAPADAPVGPGQPETAEHGPDQVVQRAPLPGQATGAATTDDGHEATSVASVIEGGVAPSDGPGWLKLARELRGDHPEQAIQAALRAADLVANPAEALWLAADLLARSDDLADFGSVIERLEPLDRLDDKALRRCATLTITAGDYQRTLTIGAELKRRSPSAPATLFAIAVAHWESGDEDAALATAAPLWAPGASDVQLRAGVRFLVRINDTEQAVALLDLMSKPDARQLLSVAKRLRQEGHLARSVELFERAIAADPEDPDAKVLLGLALADLAAVEDRWAPPVVPQRLPRVRGRVLHLLQRTAPHHLAGSTVRTHSIGRAQTRAGLDVHMVTHPGFPWNAGVDDAALCDVLDDVHYHRLRDPGPTGRTALDERLCRHLHLASELVEELRPAVLHPHSNYANALVALELGRRFGIPVVYEVRGFPEERRWSPLHSRTAIDSGATPRALERACWQRADHVTTLAEVMKRHIVASGVPAEKVTVVTNAIDPEELVPTDRDPALADALGLPDDVPVVGYISTFAPYDGIQYLIRAVARLRDRGRRVHCLLVGDGSVRAALEAEVDMLELRDRVTFTGLVDHDDIGRYYGLLDVFVVPRTNEAVSNLVTPLKPYEAMATGRALVMSRTTALSEMGIEGETARFFTPEDPESLADVLQALVEDPAQRQTLARRGRDWVIEQRNWERNVERYQDVYRQLGAL